MVDDSQLANKVHLLAIGELEEYRNWVHVVAQRRHVSIVPELEKMNEQIIEYTITILNLHREDKFQIFCLQLKNSFPQIWSSHSSDLPIRFTCLQFICSEVLTSSPTTPPQLQEWGEIPFQSRRLRKWLVWPFADGRAASYVSGQRNIIAPSGILHKVKGQGIGRNPSSQCRNRYITGRFNNN